MTRFTLMKRGSATAALRGLRRAVPVAAVAAALVIACSCEKKSAKPGKGDDAAIAKSAFDAAAGPAPKSPVYVDPAKIDFASHPRLLERLLASPYGYFRFTNIPFSQEVCNRFAGKLRGMPTVNLHGDAHLENYAITKTGRGLSDFDDSSAGPAIIDLVRFGTAIELACKEKGWDKDAPGLVQAFLKGYRDSLENPDVQLPVPALVERARKKFGSDRLVFLEFADSLMEPISEPQRAAFEPGYQRYAQLMLSEHPELPETFFAIQRLGRISVGFGSALDKKFLIRVRGMTDQLADDVILEAKEVRDLSGIACINSRESGGAFRILVGQARIAEVPHQFLAQVPQGGDTSARPFWVHAWHENYAELALAEPLTTDELEQVVYDVGVQLGRGHVRQIASPLDSQLRKAQLATLDTLGEEIRASIGALTAQTITAWEQFQDKVKRLNLAP